MLLLLGVLSLQTGFEIVVLVFSKDLRIQDFFFFKKSTWLKLQIIGGVTDEVSISMIERFYCSSVLVKFAFEVFSSSELFDN